jgi:hypothetical protein
MKADVGEFYWNCRVTPVSVQVGQKMTDNLQENLHEILHASQD